MKLEGPEQAHSLGCMTSRLRGIAVPSQAAGNRILFLQALLLLGGSQHHGHLPPLHLWRLLDGHIRAAVLHKALQQTRASRVNGSPGWAGNTDTDAAGAFPTPANRRPAPS